MFDTPTPDPSAQRRARVAFRFPWQQLVMAVGVFFASEPLAVNLFIGFARKLKESDVVFMDAFANIIRLYGERILQMAQNIWMFPIPRR